MKAPLIKILKWSICSGAIATVVVVIAAATHPTNAAAQVLEVPEPAVLLLVGVGLSAVALRVRAHRRS